MIPRMVLSCVFAVPLAAASPNGAAPNITVNGTPNGAPNAKSEDSGDAAPNANTNGAPTPDGAPTDAPPAGAAPSKVDPNSMQLELSGAKVARLAPVSQAVLGGRHLRFGIQLVMTPWLKAWLNTSIDHKDKPRAGAIVQLDPKGNEISIRSFTHGVLTAITLPGLKSPGVAILEMDVKDADFAQGSGKPHALGALPAAAARAQDLRLILAGIGDITPGLAAVGALTLRIGKKTTRVEPLHLSLKKGWRQPIATIVPAPTNASLVRFAPDKSVILSLQLLGVGPAKEGRFGSATLPIRAAHVATAP